MTRVSLKRVVAFSLLVSVGVIVLLYKTTSNQIKCSKNSQQGCPWYSIGNVTGYKVTPEPSRNATPPNSSAQVQMEFQGRGDPQIESTPLPALPVQEERFVLILIISAPYNTIPRLTIRQTWLSVLVNKSVALDRSNIRAMKDPTNASNDDLIIHYLFVCGHYYESQQKVESAVENETRVYGDILRLEYTETYSLLVHKTLTSLKFASTMNVKFVVKIDDDVYLDVPRMVWWLKTASLPEKLYGGDVLDMSHPIRNNASKYYVSYEEFNETIFPFYCNGPFYILSKNVVLEFLAASNHTRRFPLEDAYIGVLAKKVGVVPTHLREKGARLAFKLQHVERIWSDSELNKHFALGDSLTPKRLFALHKRYVNITLSQPPS